MSPRIFLSNAHRCWLACAKDGRLAHIAGTEMLAEILRMMMHRTIDAIDRAAAT